MTDDKDKTLEQLLDHLEGSGRQTDEELSALLATDSGREAWRELQSLDEAANRKMRRLPDADEAWKAFASERLGKPGRTFHMRRTFLWLAAAAVMAVAVLSVNTLLTDNDTPGSTRHSIAVGTSGPAGKSVGRTSPAATHTATVPMRTIACPARKTRRIVLPDGTEVLLNAKSRLSFPEQFTGTTRAVTLKGEAYFKVKHDASHPFVITAGGVRTKVLGTEFNIRCYDSADTHVTLVKGLVEVAGRRDTVRIHPGEDSRLTPEGSLVVSRVNLKEYTGWREGIMYFDNATLRSILQQMGEWYDVNVLCTDKALLDKHFHYMYNRNGTVEEALKLLNESSDVNATLRGNTISID